MYVCCDYCDFCCDFVIIFLRRRRDVRRSRYRRRDVVVILNDGVCFFYCEDWLVVVGLFWLLVWRCLLVCFFYFFYVGVYRWRFVLLSCLIRRRFRWCLFVFCVWLFFLLYFLIVFLNFLCWFLMCLCVVWVILWFWVFVDAVFAVTRRRKIYFSLISCL